MQEARVHYARIEDGFQIWQPVHGGELIARTLAEASGIVRTETRIYVEGRTVAEVAATLAREAVRTRPW